MIFYKYILKKATKQNNRSKSTCAQSTFLSSFKCSCTFGAKATAIVPFPIYYFWGIPSWVTRVHVGKPNMPSHVTSTWQDSHPRAADCSRQQAPVLDILMAMMVRLGRSSSQMRSRPERVGDRSHSAIMHVPGGAYRELACVAAGGW